MSEREWRFYLDDMIGFAERVLGNTDQTGQTDRQNSVCHRKGNHGSFTWFHQEKPEDPEARP